MKENKKYIFTSERLGFRNWHLGDIDKMHEINSDKKVMEFFPGIPTKEQTAEFVERMRKQLKTKVFAISQLINWKTMSSLVLSDFPNKLSKLTLHPALTSVGE